MGQSLGGRLVGGVIKAVVGVAIAVVGVVTGQFYLVAAGLAITASAFLGPAVPKVPKTSPTDRLQANLIVTTPRKWAFGNTALATDVRYDTYTGDNQDFYWQVIACASHEVDSIDELWLDNEQAWTNAGGVQGRFSGYLTVTSRPLGTSANGVAIDSVWTTASTLTGCAYLVLKYKLSDNSDNDKSPFSSGVTNRVTIRGKGAKTYDPRLDSTVVGGSGSQLASAQSTWIWDSSASRNPALQLLWFLLGWKIANPTPSGSELITNGTFTTNTAGWTPTNSGTLSVVSARLRVTNATSFGSATQAITTVAGQTYLLSVDYTAGTAGGAIIKIGTSSPGGQIVDQSGIVAGTTTIQFTAVGTTTYITVQTNTNVNGAYADFDNVSVKATTAKLAVGMGLPPARIDLPSFIAAANVCDESVTKNGGGTESRYRGDGVLSEGDDRSAVIETLCADMNATLRDAGGKIAISCIKNDLASPVAAFTENDILGEETWAQTPPLNQSFNIVRGRMIDPSDTALYQPVDFPEVSLTSIDGIDRIDTVEYMLCQSNGQAQRLAKQRLERNQYQGRYSAQFGPRAWQVSLGDVVTLSHAGLGFVTKLFRVVEQSIDRNGPTKMELLEENSAIYAWANDESPAVTPGAPTIYDPLNAPVSQGVILGGTAVSTNALKDAQFGNAWALTAGAVRHKADATLGYAIGRQPYYCELSPSTSLVRSATSELVPVSPNQRVYFKIDCQRGTTLGSGSRLNPAHEWVQANGTSTTGTPVEGAQQTPSSLTTATVPVAVYWSDVAPALAAFVRIKPYTPALASSSGTFRVEAPVISLVDPGGTPSIGTSATTYLVNYNSDGTVVSGELSFDIGVSMLLGSVAQTSGVTWTYKVKTGSVNGHVAGSTVYTMTGTGNGTLTVSSIGADASTVEITGTAANGSYALIVMSINKVYAASTPGTPSGTDAPSQTSAFTSFSSSSFGAITNTLTYTVPSGTTATVTFNITCKPVKTGTTPPWTVEFKIQRNIASVWTDVGSTMSASSDLDVTDEGITIAVPAVFSSTRQSTGLTASTQYQWRAVARLSAGATGSSGTHNVTGSISVASP
jgi:hypothetical protein